MAGAIDAATVKKATNLVKLVSQYTQLEQDSFNHWMGKCPLPTHNDDTPSFSVSRKSNGEELWHCFGCGNGGDCFNFVQAMSASSKQKMDFSGAFRFLAKEAGLEIFFDPKKKAAIDSLNRKAEAYHAGILKDVREYLYSRGITDKTIDEWKLGSSFNGIIRLEFPLLDSSCNTIGFSSRKMPWETKEVPKYINSANSNIFVKSKYFYGIHNLDKDFNEIRITEGAMDVVTASQFGIKNVVATLSHALTDDHVEIIKSKKLIPVLCFDNDAAGKQGTDKATKLFLKHGIEPKIFNIPDEMDLAEFCLSMKDKSEQYLSLHSMYYSYIAVKELMSTYDAKILEIKNQIEEESSLILSTTHGEAKARIKKIINERLGRL